MPRVRSIAVAEREEAQIATGLVSRACLRERISKGRPKPLILHADNGNAVAAGFREAIACRHAGKPPGGAGCAQILLQAKAEQRQPLLGIAVPHCVDAGPRSGEYRPDYRRRPFQSVEQACAWVAALVDKYNHQHRHSGIRFVTPDQRHRGQADAICQQRARVYEQARQRYPRR